jgi:ParB-like chromosome segregation protein Spo0J
MLDIIEKAFREAPDKTRFLDQLRAWLHEHQSPYRTQPIDHVQWVPIEKIHANDYNPNSVAPNEMRLLYWSIYHDGYTQPVVTVYDEKQDRYVIVDGFHRYTTMRLNEDIRARTGGRLPVVVLDKSINDRMASTVRHNRARGKHSVAGMGNMVFQMLENGWKDEDICKEIGLSVDELVRLKHITGFSKLFENVEYRKAWESREQILERRKWQEAHEGQDH